MTSEVGRERLDRCLRQVERRPDSASAHYNLGLAYTARGMVGQAEAAYRKALEIDPGLVEAWVNLGGTLLLKWDFQGSLEANRQALALRDDLVLAHYNIGQACMYLKDPEGVVRSCRRVIELDPEHAAGHYFLAVGLLALGQAAEAREESARAQALGHSPSPEFLRALEKAALDPDQAQNVHDGDNSGADAPTDSNRR